MKKPFEKQPPRFLDRKKSSALGGKIAKQVQQSWDLAARLEYRRIKGKGSSK